jgi:WD40 repeat protein
MPQSSFMVPSVVVAIELGSLMVFGPVGADKSEDAMVREVREFELPNDEVVQRVAFSPDGHKVAAGTLSGRLWIWDIENGRKPRKIQATVNSLLKGGVLSLAFSPDGKRILLGGADTTVQLCDSERGEILKVLKGHRGPVWSVAFFKDGKRALSGSTSDYTIREWDLEVGKQVRLFQGKELPDSLCILPDERLFVTTEFNKVQLWELLSGKRSDSLARRASV